MTTKTLDTREPLCGLFYTPEELCGDESEIEEISTKTRGDNIPLYDLHRETFFSYEPGATMADWDKYVESDSELLEIRNKYQEIL